MQLDVINPAGALIRANAGWDGDQFISDNHGRYYNAAKAGRIFIASTPIAGVTVPIYNNTTQQFGIWNPLGSGKSCSIIAAHLGYVDTTHTAGCIVWGKLESIGGGIAIPTSVTLLTPVNGRVGGGLTSLMRVMSPATVVAPSLLRAFGVSNVVQAATATNAPWTMVDYVNGAIIVDPGNAIFLAANVAAAPGKLVCSITYEEVPTN